MAIRRIITSNGETRWEVSRFTNGRRSKQLRRRFEKKTDAENFVHTYKAKKRERGKSVYDTGDFESTTFAKEAAFWLQAKADRLSPGHKKRADGALKELLPKIGSLTPAKFTPTLISHLQGEFLSQDLSASTVNRKIEIITSILNFSVKHRRIPFSPFVGFEKIKEVRDELPHWEKENAQSFLAFTNRKYPFGSRSRWVYAAYFLAINTGLRAGEIWGLKPEDFPKDSDVIMIRRQFDRVLGTFRPTKGKENRRVPCNAEIRRELTSLIENRPENAETIFYQRSGAPICHDNFRKRQWEQDLKEWGGKQIRFHDLRHTAITLLIAAGIDLKTVQEIAGHKDIKTTMGYTHLLAERIKHVAQNFSILPSIEEPTVEPKPTFRLIKGGV